VDNAMIKKTIVVYSGRFQPFHKGHYASYKKLVSKFGVGNVYIGTSDKTDSGKSPFNFKEKVQIMNKMFGIPTNKIVQVSNPYAPKEILAKFDDKTTAYIAAVGEKDASRLGGKYFRPYNGDTEYGYDVAGYTYNIPAEANAISGTDVRNWLSSDNAEQLFLKAYPKFDAEIYKLITNKLIKEELVWGYPSYEDVKELKRNLDKIRSAATTDDSYVYEPVKEQIGKLVYEADKFIDNYFSENESEVELDNISKEDINIDVDNGDTVLMGKFKNKKVVVKSIGSDEHGMPTINGKVATTFRKSKTNETVNRKSNSKAKIVGEFIRFAKQRLELNGFPKGLRMITDSEFPKQMKSFGGYNPDNDEIFVYAGNDRNIVDVVRTLAHELVHLKQRQDGRILGPEQGATGSDIENEANAAAGILLRDFGKRNRYIYEIDKSQMANIERYADSQLAPADIEFAIPHFFDRLNDPRNGKEITDAELTGFFKRLSKHKKDFLEFLKKYKEIVVKDKRNNLNIPFIKSANKVIAKTIMRKSDFKTYDYTLVTETDKTDMERELVSLYNKAFKMFPNSPAQLKIRAQIDKLIDQIAKSNDKNIKESILNDAVIGDSIVCDGCAWSWKISEGGDDTFMCHKCGYDNNPKISESILTEGGAYGHMNHPFDTEINLTFGQLKDIVNKALDGELELTREKTDGQALAISWVNGKLVAARNKGHLANKGANALDAKGVATKFSGRGELEKAYNFAMNDLSKAVSALSEKQRDKIFKNGACFMNLEVIYPTSVNVIPYGQPLLVFHGTMEYNDKGEAIGENQSAATILAGMIKQVNQNVQSNYTIQGPPVTQLPKSQNLSKLKAGYISKISKLQSKFKLSDSSGITEYHQAWWTDFIKSKSPEQLDANTLNGLVRRWAFYDKGFRLDSKTISNTKVLEWAQKIDKEDHAKIAKDNVRPFEDIFLGVGSDVLSFMSSVLTANPDSAIRNMKTRLDQTIADVQTGGDPKKIAKLKLELERLNAIGGKDKIVPNEGIVFMYNGNTMKLTGTFAPLNQILGLFY
jgi:Zn-dependent peptidase ImmA (M78 family)